MTSGAYEPTSISKLATRNPELPLRAALALDEVQRICSSMFEMTVEPCGPPGLFDPAHLEFGACISLVGEAGSWELALFGDSAGCASLARVFFVMGEDQLPAPDEIVDAMGELLNMVSGAVKTRIDSREHEKLTIGIPIFQTSHADCEKYQTKIIPLVAQRVKSPELAGTLYLIWSERTPIMLLQEARACLAQPGDKLALGNGLAALHELLEVVTDGAAAENVAAITQCQHILTDIINEQGKQSVAFVEHVIDALIEAFTEDLLLPLQMPIPAKFEPPEDVADDLQLQAVERDEETLEMLGEFLAESQEGLEKCDELLLQIESGNTNSDSIAALFRNFHTIKGVASFHGLTDIEKLAHATENVLASVRDGKRQLEGVALDLVFESTSLLSRIMVAVRSSVEKGLSFPESSAAKALKSQLDAFLRGEVVETSGLGRHTSEKPVAEATQTTLIKETVKVDIDELNELDVLLPAFRGLLGQLDSLTEPELVELRARFGKLLTQAEALSTRMRMVPLRGLFQKMTRMARDLMKKTEKLARIVIEGEDTRVGRNVVEKLNGPLVHMIRNAIDHGLEGADVRRLGAKPLMGSIRLLARTENDRLLIELSDDGKGLDAEAILQKARAKGLVAADVRPPDKDLYGLIFEAGFSTAAQVTAISGRGVGMDVVRREIEALGGRIEIESRAGLGSTFRIVLDQSAKRPPRDN